MYHRIIRDSLHGSIKISPWEDRVISHPYFQRLRYIKQLGFFHLVFPSAVHSRFEHSLGAMHLAERVFLSIKNNQIALKNQLSSAKIKLCLIEDKKVFDSVYLKNLLNSNYKNNQDFSNSTLGFKYSIKPAMQLINGLFLSDYALLVFKTAALLHDIGHCPFSHCAEKFLPSLDELIKANSGLVPKYLVESLAFVQSKSTKQALNSNTVNVNNTDEHCDSTTHEVLTIMISYLLLKQLAGFKADINAQNYLDYDVFVQDVLVVLSGCIELHPNSIFHDLAGYEILSDLLSGELDIDRMDYLKRDSIKSGVLYGFFDQDRLMDSIHVVYNCKSKRFNLCLHEKAMSAFEDFLSARKSMFKQLYFHKTSMSSEAMLSYISSELGGWKFPADLNDYLALKDQNLEMYLYKLINLKKSLPKKNQINAKKTIKAIFQKRILWKCIFEKSSDQLCFDKKQNNNDKYQHPSYLDKQCKMLDNIIDYCKKNHINYKIISSKCSLINTACKANLALISNYLNDVPANNLSRYQIFNYYFIYDLYEKLSSIQSVHLITRVYIDSDISI